MAATISYLNKQGLVVLVNEVKGFVENELDNISADATLNTTSTRPIQNAPVATAVNRIDGEISALEDAIADIIEFDAIVVDVLPATGERGIMYIVGPVGPEPKDVYVWITATSEFKQIGTTSIDLTDYVKFSDLVAITDAEIEALFD